MISKDVFSVYAQYNEDVILAALLDGVTKGFYVDVGANHETYHSVTRYFYDRGWSGINIEPIPRLLDEIAKKRKRDINLQLAISNKPGELKFREYPEHDGLSTLSDASKSEPTKLSLPFTDYTVKVETLKSVFASQNVGTIDFLKIDVEGYEAEVLEGNNWSKYRPIVVAIEANHRATDWSDFLVAQNYVRVIFDGLNEYYLDKHELSRMDGFAERATLLAHSAVRHHHVELWSGDVEQMQKLDDMTKRQDELIHNLQAELTQARAEVDRLRPHAMIDRSFPGRLKVAVNDLILAYIRPKSSK